MTNSSAALTFNEAPARMGVDAIELGQRWSEVMPEAQARYGVKPECDARKIAKKNSRRAYLLETCTYTPEALMLADLSVVSVRHYFVDQVLLRVDVGVSGSESEQAAIVEMMNARYGEGQAAAEDDAIQWQVAGDEAAVRRAENAASDGPTVMIYLRDIKAAENTFALTGW